MKNGKQEFVVKIASRDDIRLLPIPLWWTWWWISRMWPWRRNWFIWPFKRMDIPKEKIAKLWYCRYTNQH